VVTIKPHESKGWFKHEEGELEFGTDLVVAEDKSIAALLGASPGASTAASIAVGVLERCFKNELTANRWLPKLKEIIPSYGESLIEDTALTRQVRADTATVLHLDNV
jgi:malate dehydrogenase (quinone)